MQTGRDRLAMSAIPLDGLPTDTIIGASGKPCRYGFSYHLASEVA
jgi:hypothetical protein